MAKQVPPFFFTGTFGDITFYKMYDTYYARMKSSLSRKKVLTSPRFALTRMHANQLAEASRIASKLYRQIPKEEKNMKLFRAIVGQAKILLAQGENKETVLEILSTVLQPKPKPANKPKQIKNKEPQNRPYVSKAGRLIWKDIDPLKASKESLMTSGIWQLPVISETYAIKLE